MACSSKYVVRVRWFAGTSRRDARLGGPRARSCSGKRVGRSMSDGEDYGFEYSDDDQEEEDVNIENQSRGMSYG